MEDRFDRSKKVLGEEALQQLKGKKVVVFGLGGVGSACVEALARGSIGSLVLIDNDTVNMSNINRQLIATEKTLGKLKTDATKERIQDINPDTLVDTYPIFVTADNATDFISEDADFVIDCIDNVTAKLRIYQICQEKNIPVISCMGTGNKLHPEMFEITSIEKTSVCPLCKVIRKECKDRGIKGIKVLYSKEAPHYAYEAERTPGSVSFVPPVAGMMLAGYVIRDMLGGL